MHLSPMANFESQLGRSRFEALAESAHDGDRRLARLEAENIELRREIEELKGELRIAAEFRLLMHERVAKAAEH